MYDLIYIYIYIYNELIKILLYKKNNEIILYRERRSVSDNLDSYSRDFEGLRFLDLEFDLVLDVDLDLDLDPDCNFDLDRDLDRDRDFDLDLDLDLDLDRVHDLDRDLDMHLNLSTDNLDGECLKHGDSRNLLGNFSVLRIEWLYFSKSVESPTFDHCISRRVFSLRFLLKLI